jgi:hypothetical protein
MTALELKRIFQKGECLSLETMRLYQNGKLSSKSVHEVEKHLLECGLCAAALEGLSPTRRVSIDKIATHVHRRLAVYMNTPPRLSFFQRYGFAIAMVALLFVGAGSWLIYQASQPDPALADSVQKVSPPVSSPPTSATNFPEDRPANPVDFVSDQAATQPIETGNKLAAPNNPTTTQNTASLLASQLPATNQPTVAAEKKVPDQVVPESSDPKISDGSNSRNAAPAALRVKSVSVLNKVEHVERPGKSGKTTDGQLAKGAKSSGGFQLDEMPQYPGGDQALRDYVISNFKTPQIDRTKLTRFATGIAFRVNAKTGEVSNVELTYSISPEIDAELLRVMLAMPRWTPGTRRGTIDVILGFTLE